MLRGIIAFVAISTIVLQAAAASAQDGAPRGPLPGVAVPLAPSAPGAAAPLPLDAGGRAATAVVPSPSPTISPTARLYIAALQRALPSHGYRPGPETGRLDKKTIRAIKAYQRDAGLAIDARSEMALKTTLDSVTFVKPPILAH